MRPMTPPPPSRSLVLGPVGFLLGTGVLSVAASASVLRRFFVLELFNEPSWTPKLILAPSLPTSTPNEVWIGLVVSSSSCSADRASTTHSTSLSSSSTPANFVIAPRSAYTTISSLFSESRYDPMPCRFIKSTLTCRNLACSILPTRRSFSAACSSAFRTCFLRCFPLTLVPSEETKAAYCSFTFCTGPRGPRRKLPLPSTLSDDRINEKMNANKRDNGGI
mmetsp:Transcript_31376/g.56871  ORF Transcript_31376/g.56871 Transcript_31376/m.56871 type:complete len:221 (+) Transcript_31376:605-1267(+)